MEQNWMSLKAKEVLEEMLSESTTPWTTQITQCIKISYIIGRIQGLEEAFWLAEIGGDTIAALKIKERISYLKNTIKNMPEVEAGSGGGF